MTMRQIPLGRTGLRVSEMVFGGAPIGGLFAPVSDDQAAAVLEAAWTAGIRAFDTAPHYGVGLHGTPKLARVRDYSRDGTLATLEGSLRRLGIDRIDIWRPAATRSSIPALRTACSPPASGVTSRCSPRASSTAGYWPAPPRRDL